MTTATDKFVATSQVRRVARAEIRKHDDMLARGVGEALGQITRDLQARIAALEKQLADLHAMASEFRFRGHFVDGRIYQCGDVVSIPAVGLYRAERQTMVRPGSDGAGWSLLLKAGRDGRDGKDATLPDDPPAQPRTTRGTRSAR